MTPIKKVFTLSASNRLNASTLAEIFKSGFSRIPIFENDCHDCIGIILTKDLIFVDPNGTLIARMSNKKYG